MAPVDNIPPDRVAFFIELVAEMREAQRAYRERRRSQSIERCHSYRRAAEAIEARVDAALAGAWLQEELF